MVFTLTTAIPAAAIVAWSLVSVIARHLTADHKSGHVASRVESVMS